MNRLAALRHSPFGACGRSATTSGVAFWDRLSAVPACRRHPGRRNTGLRTAATPRGVAKMSASGHHLHIVHITASRYRVPPPSQLRLAPRRATLHRAAPHHHAPPLAPRHAVPHLRATSPCATACRIAPLGGNSLRRRRSCIAMLSDLSDWSDSSDGPWCYQQARLWRRGGAMMCVASTEGGAVVR